MYYPFNEQRGAYKVLMRNRFIFIKNDLHPVMENIVLLHELGHDALHREEATKVGGFKEFEIFNMRDNRMEYEANLFATIYYPSLTAALAWLSARYTLVFLTTMFPNMPLLIHINEGGVVVGPECIALMLFYLCCSYAVNALSPKLAGKIQASTTVIKLIPLGVMAIVGIIAGLASGQLTENFVAPPLAVVGSKGSILFAAVCATSFAYEGWIIATTINSELKDSKRNLPKALTVGGIIVIATYLLYYIGVTGGASNAELIEKGATVAFTNIFGNVIGNILNLFIAISCIGTMNGLMLACCRGVYSVAARGKGPATHMFSRVDEHTNMPNNSAVMGLLLCGFWGLYFYLSNLAGTWSHKTVFTGTIFESVPFLFDPTELPIITIYALYIPVFIQWIRKQKGTSVWQHYILPILAICGSVAERTGHDECELQVGGGVPLVFRLAAGGKDTRQQSHCQNACEDLFHK